MSNRLKWFAHDNDAHDDEFIQRSMDEFGQFGYSAYFITLELIHKEGSCGVLKMKAGRYASKLRSRIDLVKKWLSFCGSFRDASRDRSGEHHKIEYKFIQNRSGEDIEIEIKKFKERQYNSKSRLVRDQFEINSRLVLEEKRREEKRIQPPISPKKKGDECLGFDEFWKSYPRREAKQNAVKVWNKLAPSPSLLATILSAISKHKQKPGWQKDGGQFIPLPASWLNARRWEDEAVEVHDPDAPLSVHAYLKYQDEQKKWEEAAK